MSNLNPSKMEDLQRDLNGAKLALTRANERWYAEGEKAKKAEAQRDELIAMVESMLFDFMKFDTDEERLKEFKRLRESASELVLRLQRQNHPLDSVITDIRHPSRPPADMDQLGRVLPVGQ